METQHSSEMPQEGVSKEWLEKRIKEEITRVMKEKQAFLTKFTIHSLLQPVITHKDINNALRAMRKDKLVGLTRSGKKFYWGLIKKWQN